MSVCPICGGEELHELAGSSNAFCEDCSEVVEPTEDGDSEGMWCDTCGDMRPVDDDLCCMRCGEHV